MSSSDYTPWASRAGYEDLTPIKQADPVNSLVPIAYSEKYRDGMDTFRAVVARREKTERVLAITEALIRMNPGHYSIWAYRAQTLLSLGGDLSKELDLMDELVKEHLKSYQVWQHRRTMVTALHSSARELSFTRRALDLDAKNYHTWAYRQWVLSFFFGASLPPLVDGTPEPTTSTRAADIEGRDKVWAGELEYVDELLEDDVRNNSAWNHRFFVAFESGSEKDTEDEVLLREIDYTKAKLALSPNNPSAWNYLRGILTRTATPMSTVSAFVTPLTLSSASAARDATASGDPIVSAHAELPAFLAVEFLADAAAEEAEVLGGLAASDKAQEAASLFASLKQYDPIRTNYWQVRERESLALAGVEGPKIVEVSA